MADDMEHHTEQPQGLPTGEGTNFAPDPPPHLNPSNLPPLEPLSGAISTYEVPEAAIRECSESFPALRPFYKYGDDQTLWDRRTEALNYASDFFGNPAIKNCGHLSRKTSKTTIRVLEPGPKRGAVRMKDVEVTKTVYTLESHRFMALYYHLRKLIEASTQSFKALGKRIPSIPDWPEAAGSIGEDFLTRNEFEILTITFRSQVEQLLLRLDYIHNYSTDKSRFSPLLKEAYGSETHKYSKRDFDPQTTDSISQIVRSHRRNYEPYTSKAQGKSSYGFRSHSYRPRSTRKIEEIFEEDTSGSESERPDEERNLKSRGVNRGNGDPSDPDSSDSDNYRSNRNRRKNSRHRSSHPHNEEKGNRTTFDPLRPHFENKLKHSEVPTWDGNTETIVHWINKINDLARYGREVRKQLGSIVPRRLTGAAETWYFSLPRNDRKGLETDWKLLRQEIVGYYMNSRWMERMRRKANNATYRGEGHTHETPSEFYIRKLELLTTVYELIDGELISEIMEGAPRAWNTILTTQEYRTVRDLQHAIRYHEEILMDIDQQPMFRSQRNRSHSPSRPQHTPRAQSTESRSDLSLAPTNMAPYRNLGMDGDLSGVKDSLPNRLLGEPKSNFGEIVAQACRVSTDPISAVKKLVDRRSRHHPARQLPHSSLYNAPTDPDSSLIELRRLASRPPGHAFLSSRATEAIATINGLDDKVLVTVDSGSDITLISRSTLAALKSKPEVKPGQKIRLVQVTGSSKISGYVIVDLYFETPQGPVKFTVEAYVVDRMSTPFILGNDFQEQYGISIDRRSKGQTFLTFGQCGREMKVSDPLLQASVDRVNLIEQFHPIPRSSENQQAQRAHQRETQRLKQRIIQAATGVVVLADSCQKVPMRASFPAGSSSLFIKQFFRTLMNLENSRVSSDTLVLSQNSALSRRKYRGSTESDKHSFVFKEVSVG